MIDANSASSSANEVSISTRVAGWFGADLAGGLDPAAVGEPHVHHDHVGARALGLVDRLAHGAGLRRHDDVVLGSSSIARMPSRTIS